MGRAPLPEPASTPRSRPASPAAQWATCIEEVACFAGCVVYVGIPAIETKCRSKIAFDQLACSVGGARTRRMSERVQLRRKGSAWAALLPSPVHPVQLAGNRGITGLSSHTLAGGPRGCARSTAARDGQLECPGWCPSSDAPRRRHKRHRELRFSAVVLNTTKIFLIPQVDLSDSAHFGPIVQPDASI